MHGSGDFLYRKSIERLPDKVLLFHEEFNPSFGGFNPEPIEVNLKKLLATMEKGQYDLGIAIDGDGDRIACVLKGGRYVNAQVLVPL